MEAIQPDGYPWELLILLFVTLGYNQERQKNVKKYSLSK